MRHARSVQHRARQVTKFFAAYKKAENEKREHKDRVDRRGCAWKLCVAADVESFTILVFWYLGEASESHA